MKARITFTFFAMFLLFVSVVVKAFYVQILNRDKLLAYSHSQIAREIKIYPRRGHILDRNGSPLAINVQKQNIFTFGKNLKKIKKELQLVKKVIPSLNVQKMYSEIAQRKKFTWIERKIELKEAQVEKLRGLKEIFIEAQPSRMYPNNELLSQTLGFVGMDNEGLAGIEYSFNDELKGEAQIHKYFKDAKGRPVKLKSAIVESNSKDVTLSIDKDMQASLEEFLKEGVVKSEANLGGAAVMDAETGEIWAIANYPSYDPNNVRNSDRNNIKLSYATDPVEPGSIFKTLTVASGLKNNIIKPDTNYYCERGKLKVGKHTINESDSKHAHEWLSVSDILKFSSNVGTTKIAFDIGYPTLKKTLKEFRIGEKLGVEIPGESRGILEEKDDVRPIRLSNISFGQGVATTGLQMLAAYGAIANGGNFVTPTFLKVVNEKKIKKKRILSQKTSDTISKMLLQAVDDGTGSNARIDHFDIAGKTSTAQRVSENGGYEGYVSGFIGYPLNVSRRFVVFVYVDNPKKGYYGNTIAAPIFRKITKNVLFKNREYNQIARSRAASDKKAMDSLSSRYSSKRSIQQGIIPNFIGLDKSSASHILKVLKLEHSQKGFGIVTKQYPPAGSRIEKETVVKLRFSAPRYE